jgi:hypothetical protein
MAVTDRFWRVTLRLPNGAVMMFSVTGPTRTHAAGALFLLLHNHFPEPVRIQDITMTEQVSCAKS